MCHILYLLTYDIFKVGRVFGAWREKFFDTKFGLRLHIPINVFTNMPQAELVSLQNSKIELFEL